MRANNSLPRSSGFSMIELLVVATIMIVLTMIGLVSYQRANISARNGKRQADMETVRQALVLFRTDGNTYPAGDGSATAFESMMGDITEYITTETVEDPKNTGVYVYTYALVGTNGFSICWHKEPDPGLEQCLTNP